MGRGLCRLHAETGIMRKAHPAVTPRTSPQDLAQPGKCRPTSRVVRDCSAKETVSDEHQARLEGLCIATIADLGSFPACLLFQEAAVHCLLGKLHVMSWLWPQVQVLQAVWDVDEPCCWSALLMSMPVSALKTPCLCPCSSSGLVRGDALHQHVIRPHWVRLQRSRSYWV